MRNNLLDNIKGFAILLVVIGHLIQNSIADYDHNILWRFIYSFHMPLFFFISGFLAYLTKLDGIQLIAKRFNSLIIPFFAWAVIYFFTKSNIEMGFFEYLVDIILIPDKGLWFLWVLFFCYVLLVISKKINLNIYLSMTLFSIFLLVFSIIIKDKIFGINLISKQFPFFLMGYFTNDYKTVVFNFLKKYKYIIIILFLFFASFWMRKEDPLFYKYFNLGGLCKLGYVFFVGVLGVFASLSLFMSVKLETTNKFYSILSFIGKHTFAIYAVHFLLLDFFNIEYLGSYSFYLLVLIFTSIIVAICLLIEYVISFNTILSGVLFGSGIKAKKNVLKSVI